MIIGFISGSFSNPMRERAGSLLSISTFSALSPGPGTQKVLTRMKALMNVISQGNSVQETLGGVYTVLVPGQESDLGPVPWRPEPAVRTQAGWELEEQEVSGAGALEGGLAELGGGGRGRTKAASQQEVA